MKQYELEPDAKILLVKQKGKLSAIGTKCSHYGALLSTGALGQGRVRCPWHGACFNIETGDIEDFPGLDSIPCFHVHVDRNGEVHVRAKRTDFLSTKRLKDMVKRDTNNESTYIVIGGGPSGGVCVETLRQEGFSGRIILVCKEEYLPYDRVKVSKAMDFDVHKNEYRNIGFYDEYGIEAMTGTEATGIDTLKKTVSLSNGYNIKYDKVYIATGSKAKKISIPGADLIGVVTMRNYTDAAFVNNLIRSDTHVVCLGLSFISLESAAFLANKVEKVTVIGRDTVPLRTSFGPEIGQCIMELMQSNKIEFIMQNGIKQCFGDTEGRLHSVELNDGKKLKCEICIMGTGSNYYTEFLHNSGIQINADGSIDTDEYLQTNLPGIFVGGDIARAPVYSIGQKRAVIGHYALAQYHGRIAAKNMVTENFPIKAVPYFWTVIFGKSFRYSGYGRPQETQIIGSLKDLKFVAIFYDSEGYVCGMASCQRDPIVSQYAELQSQGKRLHKMDLTEDPMGWIKLINTD